MDEAVLVAVRVNARRGHFREAYEGFNNCPAGDGDGACDCGMAEAVIALRLLGECPHDGRSAYAAPSWVCAECGEPVG